MSKEKALTYLRLIDFKEEIAKLLAQSYSVLISDVPASVWTEVFKDLDYGPTESLAADNLCETFDEEELEILIDFAKQPAFKKLIRMQANTDIKGLGRVWHDANRDSLLLNIKRVLPAHGVEQSIIDSLVEIFSE